MNIYFNYNLPLFTYILLGIVLLCLLWILVFYIRRISRVTRAVRQANPDTETAKSESADEAEQEESSPLVFSIDGDDAAPDVPVDDFTDTSGHDTAGLPAASIVIYCQDQSSWLEEALPDILAQVYEPGFEVIVVNEGGSDATRDLVDGLSLAHPNLYLTYTPDGARNLSRKKLALTIGVKAAKNPVVVNVTAAVRIPSRNWLYSIMRNFASEGVEIVLGYACVIDGDDSYGRRRRAFDYIADSVTWLTSALAGKPYRGTEYNLTYTRDIFFRNKGFSRSLNLVNGDDDIFVNEISRRDNTVVELSYDSMTVANWLDHRAAQEDYLRRHYFTSRRLPRASALLMASGAWAIWIALAAAVGAALIQPGNMLPAAVALVLIITILLTVTLTWRRAMIALCSRRMFWTIPRLAMFRPLRMMRLALRSRRAHNYTWN